MKPHASPRWARLVTTTLLIGLVAAGCGRNDESGASPVSTDSVTTIDRGAGVTTPAETGPETAEPRVVSAEEGMAARARFQPLQRSEQTESGAVMADTSTMDCESTFEPTPEDVAAANADNQGLVDTFDRFGIEYTSSNDDFGYLMVDYAFDDVVAQSVAESYWTARYPVEPVPQAELDAIVTQNDVVAEQLDAAGVAYERRTDDSGWESLEYDYEDPAAQAAVDAAWLIISPPQPPTPEQLSIQNEDNAKLMNAFDEAGIAYELVTDDLGWAWIEWDDDDPATSEKFDALVDELYPPITIEPIQECLFTQEPMPVDVPTLDAETEELLVDPMPVEEPGVMPVEEPSVMPVDEGPAPEQVARRTAEIDAMVAGFTAAAVEHEQVGESPWQTVVFDLTNDASESVITDVLAGRS